MEDQTAPTRGRQPVGRLLTLALASVALIGVAVAATGGVPRPQDVIWRLDPTDPGTTLDDVEREVLWRYRVADMSVGRLEQALKAGSVTLFDVRTAEEYAAGHIPGAIRVEPGMSAAAFLAEHGARLTAQPAVFYCAVGVRSSRMMQQLLGDLPASRTTAVYNLRGGAFRWVTEGRHLVAGHAPGRLHPIDDSWEQLLKRTLATR
jgi:rhodanese-related sulfurtransferase